jgi:hypothetical protein
MSTNFLKIERYAGKREGSQRERQREDKVGKK